MVTAEEIVSESIKLISLPQVYTQVKQVIEDEHGSIKDLAEYIIYDPALTAQILKTANSVLWAPRYQIETICRALEVLGMRHVHDLVLAISVTEVFKNLNTEHINFLKFWKKSVFNAVTASAISKRGELIDLQRPFVEALLSDIGHMVLYHKEPVLAQKAHDLAKGDANQLVTFEKELIGCDYAEVGSQLATRWDLPECFADTIKNQNHPENSKNHLLESAILHIATRLTNKEFENEGLDLSETINTSVWTITELSEDCLPEVQIEAQQNSAAAFSMFF